MTSGGSSRVLRRGVPDHAVAVQSSKVCAARVIGRGRPSRFGLQMIPSPSLFERTATTSVQLPMSTAGRPEKVAHHLELN